MIWFQFLNYCIVFIGLKDQLEKSDQHAQKYKSIADSVEISLKEQNEVFSIWEGKRIYWNKWLLKYLKWEI